MILTLEVVGRQAQELGAGSRRIFNAVGGTIGRLPDNDWVFPDPYVSGRHALIRYLGGKYFIEDTSTNGVFVNSPDNRLARAQPHQLQDGDVLYIDAYEIKVALENDPASAQRGDPFVNLRGGGTAQLPPGPRRAPVPPEEDRTASLALRGKNQAVDAIEDDLPEDRGTEWFGASEIAQKQPAPARAKPEAIRPVGGSGKASSRRPPAAAVRAVAPPSSRRASGVSGDEAQLQALLAAAGIEGLEPSPEAARMLGEILRIAVTGVMEALRARERMKDDLRMRGTTFKAAHNNPLKFSANVDDAFHNLLVKHNPAYLDPVDAVQDAFHDVRDHQAAFLAAMRLAFESMLAQFDPSRLQDDFDRQMKKGSILGVPAKLRYWDLYRDRYGDMVKDAEASFRHLFGDEFAKAYEEQLERLRAMAKRGR
jgi:type VI secretion system FHA domain protein